ncbi:Methyltransferase domain-containing protein [Sulfitobacter brevis]|uniref:Methyltransferase domain-containing protein n=1 Tax=Sulfitobacter brevis TaxID=74348 RepID=A0A1I1UYU9_9RHOB|nr:methyltransferase domain-containing protein [Sulfitobacter brevis]SFD76002.1 Methyltransferase domain-containing protein [Sulfitobacter brevis]
MSETFLDKVYTARDAAATRELYDDWAQTYEAEVGEQGYATPDRCAAALAEFLTDKSAPILDFGCGTGLSGHALHGAGFEAIDGADISAEMLAQANDHGIYRTLHHIEPDGDLPTTTGGYIAIAAIGVLGPGAAPVSLFDTLMHSLHAGGLVVFSFNDAALAEKSNEGRINEWVDSGAASLLFREYGEHMPGLDIKSTVYVIEKK